MTKEEVFQMISDLEHQTDLFNIVIGMINNNDLENALTIAKWMEEYVNSGAITTSKIDVYELLGFIYCRMKNDEEAVPYFEFIVEHLRGCHYVSNHERRFTRMMSASQLGYIYAKQADFLNAVDCLEIAIKDKIYFTNKELKDFTKEIGLLSSMIADCYRQIEKDEYYELAKIYYKKSIKYCKKIDDIDVNVIKLLVDNYEALAILYADDPKYCKKYVSTAIEYLESVSKEEYNTDPLSDDYAEKLDSLHILYAFYTTFRT